MVLGIPAPSIVVPESAYKRTCCPQDVPAPGLLRFETAGGVGGRLFEAYQASHRRAKAHQSYLTTSVRKARESIEVLDNSPLTAGTVKMVTVHPPEPAGPKQILLG